MSEPFADSSSVFDNLDATGKATQTTKGLEVQEVQPSWSRFDFRSILAVTIGVAAVLGIGKQNLELGVVLGCILSFVWGAFALVGPVASSRSRMWLIVFTSGVSATLLSFFAQTLVYGLHMRVTWVFAAVLTQVFALVLFCFYSARFRKALRWAGLVSGLIVLPLALTVSYFRTSGELWAEQNIYYVGREYLLTLPTSYGVETRGMERENAMLNWLGEARMLVGLSRCVSIYLNELPKPEDLERLKELRHCKSVILQQLPVDDELLRAIAAMPALESLSIYGSTSIEDFRALKGASRLQSIYISKTQLESVRGLGELRALESLYADDVGMPKDVAAELIQSPVLITVAVSGRMSEEDLIALMEEKKRRLADGDFRTLSSLQLGYTDASIDTIQEFLKVAKSVHPQLPTLQLTPEQKWALANLDAEDWEKASTVEATQGK